MTEYNSLEKIRLQKLEELRAEGIEPYPTRAQRTHTSAQAIAEFEAAEKDGHEVKAVLAGRIRATRAMGKISFAHIEDGDGKIQLFFRMNEVGKENLDFFNKMFDIGDFIQAGGVMFRTKTGEPTLHVHEFRMLAKSVSPLPAAKDEILRKTALSSATPRWRIRSCAPASAMLTWRSTRMCARPSASGRPSSGPCVISWTIMAFWRSRRRSCSRSMAARRRVPLRPITTSSSRICTCASRSSCI